MSSQSVEIAVIEHLIKRDRGLDLSEDLSPMNSDEDSDGEVPPPPILKPETPDEHKVKEIVDAFC